MYTRGFEFVSVPLLFEASENPKTSELHQKRSKCQLIFCKFHKATDVNTFYDQLTKQEADNSAFIKAAHALLIR